MSMSSGVTFRMQKAANIGWEFKSRSKQETIGKIDTIEKWNVGVLFESSGGSHPVCRGGCRV